ncbi:MAG: DNA methyltransferase [Gammaproteobacteria bacterium]|nr:DNA methyltransferase [Gammaproteobacteria bacterium]
MKTKTEPNILEDRQNLLNTIEASNWATEYTGKKVSEANIQYLIQYNRIPVATYEGRSLLDPVDLEEYYTSRSYKREQLYKDRLGKDLHWHLSFDQYSESETTKHVHRLHPYKGKYIPQLVEYFLDSHKDAYKKNTYFEPGDIVLDPFSGSGTTLVQANELGLHSVGVDISSFNCAITNAKLSKVSLEKLAYMIALVEEKIRLDDVSRSINNLDRVISSHLSEINREYFPKPEFQRKIRNGEIDENEYSSKHVATFTKWYMKKMSAYFDTEYRSVLNADFLNKWLAPSVQAEVSSAIRTIENFEVCPERQMLRIILSRTVRSCRATKHSDLATLYEPVTKPYYCKKHYKICKPLLSSLSWWRRYSRDTLKRLSEFSNLRTNTVQFCIEGDARTLDIYREISKEQPELAELVREKGISGIMTSPPYVGIIDYHEQHAYAYELYRLPRKDKHEIGPLSGGSGSKARTSYVDGIVTVLTNCSTLLKKSANIFIVVNDKFDLYPEIIDRSGLQIEYQYKRPVLNRAEGIKGFYSESIFHCKERRYDH